LKRILLVDNYDSFTYNLVHYFESLDCKVTVLFNDQLDAIVTTEFDAVVLSPGPGLPAEAGQLLPFVHQILGKKPILGVCLGMQALALALGGALYNQKVVKHGLQEEIHTKSSVLFQEMEPTIAVGLYHSWAITEDGDYEVTATSEHNIIMAIENEVKKCYAVQFHPESIMTPTGKKILGNFLKEIEVGQELVSAE